MIATATAPTVPSFKAGKTYPALRNESGEEFECEVKLHRVASGHLDHQVNYDGAIRVATWNNEAQRFEFTF